MRWPLTRRSGRTDCRDVAVVQDTARETVAAVEGEAFAIGPADSDALVAGDPHGPEDAADSPEGTDVFAPPREV